MKENLLPASPPEPEPHPAEECYWNNGYGEYEELLQMLQLIYAASKKNHPAREDGLLQEFSRGSF